MQIARMYYPLRTLGYGERVGIWMVGCPHRCFNCCNPELQSEDATKEIDVEQLLISISKLSGKVDGVTISGGDPFYQIEELAQLVLGLRSLGIEDILIYTGYTLETLLTWNQPEVVVVLDSIGALIDGLYIEKLNDNKPLRGSSNQRLFVMNDKFRERYHTLIGGERMIQNVFFRNELVTFGIPPKGFHQDLSTSLKKEAIVLNQGDER